MSSEAVKQITYLATALKTPRISQAVTRLAAQARDAGRSHKDYLTAVLEREVAARNASGTEQRIRAAGFPSAKTIEDFDFGVQPAIRDQIAPLVAGGYLSEARNIVLLRPPEGTGKSHLAIGLGIAARTGRRVLFATATEWVARLQQAHQVGRLEAELKRLAVTHWSSSTRSATQPFEQDAANLFFQLVSTRYEHASLILTSNLPFSSRGGVFADQVVAAAMIDRIVHHANVLTLEAANYRLRNLSIDTLPSVRTDHNQAD